MRLIDADALLDAVQGAIDIMTEHGVNMMAASVPMAIIKGTPTVDAAPVVRCRNCKHYNTNGCADGFGWCEHSGNGHGSTDNWFCADSERRGDDAAD